jgi:hypothetical protein
MRIPGCEINAFKQLILSQPEFLDTNYIVKKYRSYDLCVCSDPFNTETLEPIIHALKHSLPFSVIRIGDGEANILSYCNDTPDTSTLDTVVFQEIVNMQQDAFKIDTSWMIALREMMLSSLSQANIIGVTGIWRPGNPTVTDIAERFVTNPRAFSGHWRAISQMLKLASQGYFNGKMIASAHLYFGVLDHLNKIIPLAKEVLIISSCHPLINKLKKKYPNTKFSFLPVGINKEKASYDENTPIFLSRIYTALPLKMNDMLVLIGAGPWAEIYCSWVKQRGGVAIDIGSGFDLLDGKLTRPVHKMIDFKQVKKHAL